MELQTERLSLRPMSDAELQTLMEAVRPRDAELADAYNDMLRGSREHPQARLWYTAWGAYRKNTGELVGDLCFKGPSAQPEIGYGMIEAFWGRGYATEACGAAVEAAFARGVHRVFAECNPENAASWHLLERLGFRREGLLRQNIFFRRDGDGRPVWQDTCVYARLREDGR